MQHAQAIGNGTMGCIDFKQYLWEVCSKTSVTVHMQGAKEVGTELFRGFKGAAR